METIGIALAFVGAALAVGLACSGSARGVGSVGEVGAGVLANDPGKFSQILILQIIPGTQGLYGLVAWFFALMKLGFFSGELRVLTGSEGLMFFGGLSAHGHRWLAVRHCTGKVCSGRRGPGVQAVRGAVQGDYHGHHGGVLCHFVPAGILPDAQ